MRQTIGMALIALSGLSTVHATVDTSNIPTNATGFTNFPALDILTSNSSSGNWTYNTAIKILPSNFTVYANATSFSERSWISSPPNTPFTGSSTKRSVISLRFGSPGDINYPKAIDKASANGGCDGVWGQVCSNTLRRVLPSYFPVDQGTGIMDYISDISKEDVKRVREVCGSFVDVSGSTGISQGKLVSPDISTVPPYAPLDGTFDAYLIDNEQPITSDSLSLSSSSLQKQYATFVHQVQYQIFVSGPVVKAALAAGQTVNTTDIAIDFVCVQVDTAKNGSLSLPWSAGSSIRLNRYTWSVIAALGLSFILAR